MVFLYKLTIPYFSIPINDEKEQIYIIMIRHIVQPTTVKKDMKKHKTVNKARI